jgi:CHAD domain-containing protein
MKLRKTAESPPDQPVLHLDDGMRTDAAAKTILRHQFEIMQAMEAGAIAGLDAECLHDFRVAVRRTRSALGQIPGIFPQRKLTRFRNGFAWLGEVTGPARDMDVYLLHYDDYAARLPLAAQSDLQPLRTFLETHQNRERERLAKALGSHRYRQLLAAWGGFLGEAVPGKTVLPNAMRPVSAVAGEQIARAYRRVLKQGKAIRRSSPPPDLHQLRKSCKKLRYLLEFFQAFYAPKKIARLIKALKTLQDNLGLFQDLEVHAGALRTFSTQMVEEQQVPAATLMAMGMLAADLQQQQHQVRKEFRERFAEFQRARHRQVFEELFPVRERPGPVTRVDGSVLDSSGEQG